MTRTLCALVFVLAGCSATDDDDSSALEPRVVVLDDDDEGDDDDATNEGTPEPEPETLLTECLEVEPNEAPVISGETITLDPPWEDSTDCGVVPAGPGAVIGMRGRLGHVLQNTWEGDNDTFRFTTTEAIYPRVVVQWDPLVGDIDARLWCDTPVGYQDAAGGNLASTRQPESILVTEFALEPGVDCYLFVVAYAGAVVDYLAWLEVN